MFGSPSPLIVVFVDRNRLQFYGGHFTTVPALDIPQTILKDLEIVNRDSLYTLVNQWLKQNAVGGGAQVMFILSAQTYFEKTITATGESEQETEILAFYDSVPFDELTTKIIPVNNKKTAIATNKDLVEGLRHAFTLQGLRVVAAVPAAILGALGAKRWLDAETGSYVVKHADTIRGQSMLEKEEEAPLLGGPVPASGAGKNNQRLLVLVGVFGVLLLALIFVIVRRT